MTRGKKALLALGSIVALLVLALGLTAFYAVGPGGDRLLGQLTLPDGTQVRVEQTYNGNIFEPYAIDLYYKPANGAWAGATSNTKTRAGPRRVWNSMRPATRLRSTGGKPCGRSFSQKETGSPSTVPTTGNFPRLRRSDFPAIRQTREERRTAPLPQMTLTPGQPGLTPWPTKKNSRRAPLA
jgi:hypothetical protein